MKNLSAKPEFSEPNKIKIILLVFQSSIILYKIRILTTNEEKLGKLRFFNFVQWCPSYRHWTYNYFDLLKCFSRQCEKALSAPVSRTHPSHLRRVWLESSEWWVCWKVFECGGYECECVMLSVQCESEQCCIWECPIIFPGITYWPLVIFRNPWLERLCSLHHAPWNGGYR